MKAMRVVVCCAFVLSGCVLFAQEPEAEVLGPLSPVLTAAMPPSSRAYFDWTSVADGSARLGTGGGAEFAKEHSASCLSAMLRDRWVPADLLERMLPLRAEVPGVWPAGTEIVQYDAVRVHYELETCPIWATQTSSWIGIAVKPGVALEAAGTPATDHKQLIAATARLFLNVPDEQVAQCFAKTKTADGVTESVAGPDGEQWYHRLISWTDGDTVVFMCSKSHGGTEIYAVKWFEWLRRRYAVEGE